MQDYTKFLRIAAYCRVSTDKDDQVNSLESQKRYFSEYIQRKPMWELAEIYADEGVTGTSTKKRHAFNRMIEDATYHKFDLVITKEISRFARNTLDSIFYTRKLKEFGVGVIFMNDNINTLDADAELRLTIMSSIAQEESRKTSDRVKWGQKRKMEQGVVFGRDMLGYDVKNGQLIINKQGAEAVRLIFHKFVYEDKGTHVIARELREAGIQTAAYMKQWSNTVILRVLRNEKYCGDLVQKKTYTPSYLDHQKKCNNGEEEFVVIRDHHEPIISRELFDEAQKELKRRSPSAEQKSKHSNRYCFSGKIKCGVCGNSYVSRTKKRRDGSTYKVWKCFEGAKNGKCHIDKAGNEIGCNNRSLNDEDLKVIIIQVVKQLLIDRETLLENLMTIIKSIFELQSKQPSSLEKLKNQMLVVTEKKKGLIELYLSQEIEKVYFQEMSIKYEQQIALLEEKYKQQSIEDETMKNMEKTLDDIKNSVYRLICGEEWDDIFYRNMLEKTVVNSDNTIDVIFNMLTKSIKYFTCKVAKPQDLINEIPNDIKAKYGVQFETSLPISVKIALTSL